jgi:hypothetical protein
MHRSPRLALVGWLLVCAPIVLAEETVGPTLPPAATATNDVSLVSPRSAVRGFLTAARDGFDQEKARVAADTVRRWRETGALFLPDFPPGEASRLADTIDYPPKGAPQPG